MIVVECNKCGEQQSGTFLELNGHIGKVFLHRSFSVESCHEAETHLCGRCYEELCAMLHVKGGKR